MSRLPRLPQAKRGGDGAKRGEFVLAVCGPPSAVHCRGLLRRCAPRNDTGCDMEQSACPACHACHERSVVEQSQEKAFCICNLFHQQESLRKEDPSQRLSASTALKGKPYCRNETRQASKTTYACETVAVFALVLPVSKSKKTLTK